LSATAAALVKAELLSTTTGFSGESPSLVVIALLTPSVTAAVGSAETEAEGGTVALVFVSPSFTALTALTAFRVASLSATAVGSVGTSTHTSLYLMLGKRIAPGRSVRLIITCKSTEGEMLSKKMKEITNMKGCCELFVVPFKSLASYV